MYCRFSDVLRTIFLFINKFKPGWACAIENEYSSHRCRSCRTAKIDAKYITVNCSCIFNYVQVQYVIYQPKNHINVSKYIYYRQDEVILTIVYQIESRSQFKVGIKVTFILNSRLCGQCSQTTIPDYGQNGKFTLLIAVK